MTTEVNSARKARRGPHVDAMSEPLPPLPLTCVITRDAARHSRMSGLGRFASQMIVVDSGSGDDTENCAQLRALSSSKRGWDWAAEELRGRAAANDWVLPGCGRSVSPIGACLSIRHCSTRSSMVRMPRRNVFWAMARTARYRTGRAAVRSPPSARAMSREKSDLDGSGVSPAT